MGQILYYLGARLFVRVTDGEPYAIDYYQIGLMRLKRTTENITSSSLPEHFFLLWIIFMSFRQSSVLDD